MEDRPPSILVVDDNIDNIQVLGKILKSEKYCVEFATDGISALNFIKEKKFDIILLDINMPVINGFEVCTRIKSNPGTKDIPVIFVTANTDHDSLITGFDAGGVDYITKPFLKSELLARVKTQVSIKQARDNIESYVEEIETKNRHITDSVNYASRIQNGILRLGKNDYDFLPDNFILFLPKDILGGDFYRFYETDGGFISAVMDCTGHGVPGALMSILGATLIDEIIMQEDITRPDMILNRLSERLTVSLDQEKEGNTVPDGLEGSVIDFDRRSARLSFSGSYNNMIIVRGKKVIKIMADKNSIGYGFYTSKFSLKEVDIKKDDCVYLFSDGYSDQFGGINDKKFMVKSFKELLLDISHEPIKMQKELLLDTLNNWRGYKEQTDDIMVIGYRF